MRNRARGQAQPKSKFPKKLNIDYAFRNDSAHLYIIFIFQDPKSLSTIEATGIKVFINNEDKKKKDWGLRFFKKLAKPDEVIAVMEQKGQTVSDEEKARIRAGNVYAMYDYELLSKNKSKPASPPSSGGDSRVSGGQQRSGDTRFLDRRPDRGSSQPGFRA